MPTTSYIPVTSGGGPVTKVATVEVRSLPHEPATTRLLARSDEKSPNREWLGLQDWWNRGLSRPSPLLAIWAAAPHSPLNPPASTAAPRRICAVPVSLEPNPRPFRRTASGCSGDSLLSSQRVAPRQRPRGPAASTLLHMPTSSDRTASAPHPAGEVTCPASRHGSRRSMYSVSWNFRCWATPTCPAANSRPG